LKILLTDNTMKGKVNRIVRVFRIIKEDTRTCQALASNPSLCQTKVLAMLHICRFVRTQHVPAICTVQNAKHWGEIRLRDGTQCEAHLKTYLTYNE
jgi:hypothetical protein